MQRRLIENCSMFMVMSAEVNASVRIGLLVFVPEISMLKMNLALAAQSLKKSMKFFTKIVVDRHILSRDIATELNIDHKTVLNHIHKTGYKKKLDTWVPHELTVKNLMDRVSICESLLKRNEIEPFLKRMITGNEKWITYVNNVRKRSWSKPGEASQTAAKPVVTPRKVMLSAWWDWKGIHHELLEAGQTINSTLYCQQLMRLKQAVKKKTARIDQ